MPFFLPHSLTLRLAAIVREDGRQLREVPPRPRQRCRIRLREGLGRLDHHVGGAVLGRLRQRVLAHRRVPKEYGRHWKKSQSVQGDNSGG